MTVTIIRADDTVTLYHGDCRDIRSWLTIGDVLITDPPYGINYRSGQRRATVRNSIRGDADTALRDEVLALWNLSSPTTRAAALFGTWRRPRPSNVKALLVWDTKGALGMGDTRLPWKPAHQEIYILGNGWHRPPHSGRDTDVIVCPPVQSLGYNGRLHPHQKPVPVMAHLIERAPAGLIVDPFAGSGSTLVAAKMLGFPAIGIEIEEGDCEQAAKRLNQAAIGGAA